MDNQHKKIINAWTMYDWANSAFATTIMGAVLPVYYATVAAADLPGNSATVYWAYTTSISLLLAARSILSTEPSSRMTSTSWNSVVL